MTSKVVYAEYAYSVSLENGTSDKEYRAGQQMTERIYTGEITADPKTIESTANTEYRPWIRIRFPKSTLRVICENAGTHLIVHAILRRQNDTYDVAHKLWLEHRSLA